MISLFSCESTITPIDESVGIYPPTHEVTIIRNEVASISNFITTDVTLPAESWTLCYWWKFERFNHYEDNLLSIATQGIVHNKNAIYLSKQLYLLVTKKSVFFTRHFQSELSVHKSGADNY